MQDTPYPNKQITGNVGMFYACYQLSRLGLNVMPTSRNAKGADIVAYTQDQSTFFTFQLEETTKLTNICLGKSLDQIECDWWIVVVDVYEDPTAFILSRDEVKATARLHDDTYWAQGSKFDTDLSRNTWSRINKPIESVIPEVPRAARLLKQRSHIGPKLIANEFERKGIKRVWEFRDKSKWILSSRNGGVVIAFDSENELTTWWETQIGSYAMKLSAGDPRKRGKSSVSREQTQVGPRKENVKSKAQQAQTRRSPNKKNVKLKTGRRKKQDGFIDEDTLGSRFGKSHDHLIPMSKKYDMPEIDLQ